MAVRALLFTAVVLVAYATASAFFVFSTPLSGRAASLAAP